MIHPPGLRPGHLPRRCESGFLLPQTPQHLGGVALTYPPAYSPSRLLRFLQRPSPRVATQRGDGVKASTSCRHPLAASHRPQTHSGALRTFSAPHLFGRHRPLPRTAPAALAGATATLRHFRRLPGFRPAQRLSVLRHVRSGSYRPLALVPLAPGRCSDRIL